jgi:SNF2 family DNA or RNA helicase
MRRPIRDDEDDIIGYEVLFAALSSRCEHILALTGTPLPNRPREAYTLARALCFDSIDWMSEDSFKERFNPSCTIEKVDKETGKTKLITIEKAGRHGELQNRMRANFMTRHLKREVLPHLKLPLYDVILMEPNAAIKQALAAESLLQIDPDDEKLFKAAFDAFGGDIARVRHMMGVALAPLVAEHAEMLLDGGEEKLVIFGWHIEVLNIIERKLGRKHGFVRIDGSVSAVRKQMLVDQFAKNDGVQLLLGNMQSIGTGTDGLQKVAWHALFAECSWVNGENQQAVDRLDRGGQTRTVQADFCVAPGSIGERILSSAIRKGRETEKVLDKRGFK